MSKIVSIEEADFEFKDEYSSDYSGYVITLEDGTTIKFGIDNSQQCCENWGYFMSQDDLSEFIGAAIFSVESVDECLNVSKVPEMYSGGCMFVNIGTTKGLLQFTAYNDHNGYYSHDAVVIENGVKTYSEWV